MDRPTMQSIMFLHLTAKYHVGINPLRNTTIERERKKRWSLTIDFKIREFIKNKTKLNKKKRSDMLLKEKIL